MQQEEESQINMPVVKNEPMTLSTMEQYAKYFVASGLFPDMNTLSKAVVKIMAGMELGRSPFWSMKNINIIQGKPELNAGGLADLAKSSGRYDYLIKEWDDEHCLIEWYDLKIRGKDTPIGTSGFNKEEATLSGLVNKDNWKKWPKAMYFARALSQGVRTYAPDIAGGTVYVAGEISESENVVTPAKIDEVNTDKEYKRVLDHIVNSSTIEELKEVEGLIEKYNLASQFMEKLDLLSKPKAVNSNKEKVLDKAQEWVSKGNNEKS